VSLASADLETRVANRKQVLIAEIIDHKMNSCRFGAADAVDKLKARLSELANIRRAGDGETETLQLEEWITK
jgi:hypothetical protein